MAPPPSITVTVPTYWTWEDGRVRPGDVVYDHPTPLGQEGTLARLLESLRIVKGPEFSVLIITATTDPKLEEAAEAKVEEIIAPFKGSFPIAQFAASELALLRERLARLGFQAADAADLQQELVSLQGYGNVRNLQLIGAYLLGSQVIVGLDDDEVITDEDYLRKATEFIGREHEGEFVGGVGGFYLDSKGSNKLPADERASSNIFRRKGAIMNAAIEALEEEPGRLVETPFVLGGNMVLHRRLVEQVPFDPYITRGEDIDYLINARMAGYRFFLDKELSVVHLPPPAGSHLREDVIRFIYEREKLRLARYQPGLEAVPPGSLDPYPGIFLGDDLEEQAREALREQGLPEAIVDDAKRYAQEMAPRYFELYRRWPHLMRALEGDELLKSRLVRKMGL